MSAKEVARAFRWHRAFLKHRTAAQEVAPLSRYTNFTLGKVWEQYDCQTQLLNREALFPLMKRNPEAFDADVDTWGALQFSVAQPKSSAFGPAGK
mmetsp:Transcript_3479/g.5356  ORF Transcript_3479/g.5356 Transcript_3479/m.5356 type:complete len:95 (-) Transcript_3479:116-400(-)